MAANSPPAPAPSASGPAPSAALSTCPKCGASVAAGTKFCPQCGAAIGAPSTPTAPTAPPVDIRQKVDQDRGALKKLQLLIPGYRGYRLGEDIRDADSILRREIADKLVGCLDQLKTARQGLTQANQFGSLNTLALLISDLTTLEGRIRHAEQGYSGISAAIRVGPGDLDKLYEYDYGFALAADQFRQEMGKLLDATGANDAARITSEVATTRGLLDQLSRAFQARMNTIEGIRV
jgi:zinc-ribbon domain